MKKKLSLGLWGEELACNYLKTKGYIVVERNLKIGNQELDAIAFKEDQLIIVEVKTRLQALNSSAQDMMTRAKIKNLKIGSAGFIRRFKVRYRKIRFDFIALDVNKKDMTVKIKHFKGII